MHDGRKVRLASVFHRLSAPALLLSAALLPSTSASADDAARASVHKYAVRLFLADGSVADVAGVTTIAVPSGEETDVVSARMPSGDILQASSRTEHVWDTFELNVRSGNVSLTLRGTMGFGLHERLPDGLMLKVGDTVYRWLAFPTGTGCEGTEARKKMQAAVAKLPQKFLSDLAVLAGLPATGTDAWTLSVSGLYLSLTELFAEQPAPVKLTTVQPLEPEVAEKLLAGK